MMRCFYIVSICVGVFFAAGRGKEVQGASPSSALACEYALLAAQGIPAAVAERVLQAEIGQTVRFRIGKEISQGVLSDIDFDGVFLRDENGKARRFEHRDILDWSLVSTSLASIPRGELKAERLENRKRYVEFLRVDHWGKAGPGIQAEILELRQDSDRSAIKTRLKAAGKELFELLKTRFKTDAIGLHFNLHGGAAPQYADQGGILIGSNNPVFLRSDGVMANRNSSSNGQIYFFRAPEESIDEILSKPSSDSAFFPMSLFARFTRMGSTLILFDLKSPQLRQASADGGVLNPGKYSLDFSEPWFRGQPYNAVGNGRIGIPYESFLLPPLRVFKDLKSILGMKRLSRDEQTLAVLRYIQAVAKDSGNYIGKNWNFK